MQRSSDTVQPSEGRKAREDRFSEVGSRGASCRTILLLGSGALKIGEAGEFDYSGSQAIKAFKSEGKKVILVNPNIATNQTNAGLADEIYFYPVTADFVAKIIEKEKPDAIALSFGGQTALNCGLALAESGILERYGMMVLGTSIEAIRKTEDRALFKAELESIVVDVARSRACARSGEALSAAREIGFPVIVRAAFALGGKGSGRAREEHELMDLLSVAFVESPQVLVEEDLTGWKEIEYEVVRDMANNCITVCNMENVDPMGIHTGESIVVAPSQTLSNAEYHLLRSISLKVIRHFGIVGECNIQFALDPRAERYRVIEVNARLSRSSALASKATGYPLAFVAAKLALGKTLPSLRNAVTQVTSSDFEPSLDYVAVKVPRWDLQKFHHVSDTVTSEMKSVGEVMALGRSFEEALQKALRMINVGSEGLFPHPMQFPDLVSEVKRPTPRRIFALAEALREGWSIEEVAGVTGIDPWFLQRIQACAALSRKLSEGKTRPLDRALLLMAKRMGFSDRGIAFIRGEDAHTVRAHRLKEGILPCVKQIDTLAGEFPAKTNYLYMTYGGEEDDISFGVTERAVGNWQLAVSKREKANSQLLSAASPKRAIVLGGGPYSIGSSVEFDWCCVQAVRELQRQGYEVTMINSNPETVSTDYDECDALFFEELSLERVLDVIDRTKPEGTVVSMGGQIPNSLAPKLAAVLKRAAVPCTHGGAAEGTLREPEGSPLGPELEAEGSEPRMAAAGRTPRIFGTNPSDIDRAEDRHKFSALLDELKIDQPEWKEFSEIALAKKFADMCGYPVIVRPSYVLSGAAMAVVHSPEDLEGYLAQATLVSPEAPVVISKFEQGAKEIDFDAVAQNGKLLLYALSEHVENAGVHSGDATLVLPPQRLNIETLNRIKVIAKQIANALQISGPFNLQLLAKENRIKVIECNLRASRSFPFASKVTNVNFVQLATQALLGNAPTGVRYQTLDLDFVGVKAAQFSFARLRGADPRLGVEMASTGEVACFGDTAEEALLASLISVGFRMPKKPARPNDFGRSGGNILFTIGELSDKSDLFPVMEKLYEMHFVLYATEKTHAFLQSHGVPSVMLHKVREPRSPNIREYLEERRLDLVVNIPAHYRGKEITDGYLMRRLAIDRGIPLITNVQLAKRLVEAMEKITVEDIRVKSWREFVGNSV